MFIKDIMFIVNVII